MSAAAQVLPTGTVGAEVMGVDLAAVSAAQIGAIKQAWYRHDVLIFRNQTMTDDDLLSFSKHFGQLDPPPNQGAGRKSPPGYPDVYVVSNVLDEKGELRRFVNVYLNGDDIRFLNQLESKVKDGDDISIVPAIAGGR